MKKIVITGANSFVGRRLCYKLADMGNKVYAVVRNKYTMDLERCVEQRISIIECEMSNYSNIGAFLENNIDIAIMMSWNGTRGESRMDKKLQENNYLYSVECVNELERLGCKTFVTAGSQAEYGNCYETEKVKEDRICKPNTEYGKAKLALYEKLYDYSQKHDIRVIEPRFFSLYGEDDYEGTMLITLVKKLLADEECGLTECKQLWDFMYVDDAVEALVGLIESDTASGVYNFGTGEAKCLREYVEYIGDMIGHKDRILYGAIPYPSTGMVNTNPNIDRLCKELNWNPRVGFKQGITRVIDFQRKINETN